jgi:hypothetical protein
MRTFVGVLAFVAAGAALSDGLVACAGFCVYAGGALVGW